ncbi:murein hydrolase activator EnvC [cf. Phormidesmis sp. LEGE 11477]|uniref:murein hydrolase activator EnvC family protein n=1 Tax=cf. Phormidesmis sp. LEGE 11477 TaxID=1828680 RepID=UPI0018800019|nr:M23 family metallopeptidase [cf. Phormidesmis sp. LEGE 11477]MBE9061165.1 peptidoglycan DD-metalloendopeptidase family protein [cf. Phormidesmis sp. LEGE 11477]
MKFNLTATIWRQLSGDSFGELVRSMILWHRRWRQRWQRYWILGIAVALSGYILLGSPLWHSDRPAKAQSVGQSVAQSVDPAVDPAVNQLRQQRQQVDQQLEIFDEANQRYRKAENQANQKIRNLSKTIQSTDTWITNTEYQLGEAEQQLRLLEADLDENKQDYEQARTAVVGRLQFMQRQQGAYGWALLLQSHNLNDFLDRRYRLKQVYEADRALLASLEDRSVGIVDQQQGIEQQKNAIALLRQQLLVSRAQYTTQVKQQSGLITRLKENRGALEAAINQLDRDSDQLTALILERVSAAGTAGERMAREEALRAARSSGKMLRPATGPITSHFGKRYHPVLGYSRFHAGTDFGAPHGSPILAAETGIVIFAGWYGGYGNSLILDHGDGLTTLYAHASKLNVAEGATVKKGEAIAAIGTTGLSTGPHLHFEVRKAGKPTNPMNFL